MAKNTYIKSPLNYTGGKHKLLPQIIPIIYDKPYGYDNFVDLFTGGANVAVNADANRIIANDADCRVIDIYKRFQLLNIEEIIAHINYRINQFKLDKLNQDGFIELRSMYNESEDKDPLDLFVLICYSFNHQIRFNQKGEYNMPFGKNRSEYNPNIEKNLKAFHDKIGRIVFTCKDFRELKVDKLGERDIVYCDPPYLITCATYNEKDGWNNTCEIDLLNLLDEINEKGVRFALSNVLENKGEENALLKKWSIKYNVHHLNYTYSNCNYHAKDKSKEGTDEVLITNF